LEESTCCRHTAEHCGQGRIKTKFGPENNLIHTPWAYFTNGPNAAASIAPTLIRHSDIDCGNLCDPQWLPAAVSE